LAVLIDGRYLRVPSRGIGYFLRNIISSLPPGQTSVYLLCPANSVPTLPEEVPDLLTIVPAPWPGHFFWEQLLLPLYIGYLRPSVVYSPGNTGPLIRPRGPSYIATIHDISYLQPLNIVPFPWLSMRQLLGRVYRAYIVPKVIKHYDHIVTVSEFALRDINSHFPDFISKTSYIYHGLPPNPPCISPLPPSKNIICITGSDPQKNTASLLAALDSVKQNLLGWKVHFVGLGRPSNSTLLHNGCSILYHGSLSRSQLSSLMSYSYAMILPSHYESFGLPILDANIFDLHLALSDTGAFEEIAGPTSIYFNPKSEPSISSAIEQLTALFPLPPDKIRLERNLSRFPAWSEVATYYLQLFQASSKH